ncbi:MAG: hypothetical protein ACTSVC_06880, partial [Promethearchaeota archaeon]
MVAFFGTLFILFLYRTLKTRRYVITYTLSLFSGFLGGIVAVLRDYLENTPIEYNDTALLALQITCYSFQFMFFYLFMERMISTRINFIRGAVMLLFFMLDIFSTWLIVLFQGYGVNSYLWLFSDIGYNNLALYVTLIIGYPIYFRAYKYTNERKNISLANALILIGVGFILQSIGDYTHFLGIGGGIFNILSIIYGLLEALGLLIFTIIYISDINYVYRLPFDVFSLKILYKEGMELYNINPITKRPLKIESELFSGFMSAINSIFRNVFNS